MREYPPTIIAQRILRNLAEAVLGSEVRCWARPVGNFEKPQNSYIEPSSSMPPPKIRRRDPLPNKFVILRTEISPI